MARRVQEPLRREKAAELLWAAALDIDAAATRTSRKFEELDKGGASRKFVAATRQAAESTAQAAKVLRQALLGPDPDYDGPRAPPRK